MKLLKRCLKRGTCAENVQNAIHVEEMLPRHSECDMCRERDVWVLRMRYMSKKRYSGPQNATHVAEAPSMRSECDTCRENAAWVLRTR